MTSVNYKTVLLVIDDGPLKLVLLCDALPVLAIIMLPHSVASLILTT